MSRSWWENEAILDQFRSWLTQTDEEIDSLDAADSAESAPPPAEADCDTAERDELPPEPDFDAAGHGEPPAEPNCDAAERDEPPAEPDCDAAERDQPAEPLPEVGLLQLVEAFTALRQESKLQTKGTRALEESVQSALRGLEAATRQFQSVQSREQEAADRAVLPLIEALVGLDEALLRGAQAFGATHRQMTQSAPMRLRTALDEAFQRQPWWRRWAARGWHGQVQELAAAAFARTNDEEFASLMEGYRLIQVRMERMLTQYQIHRIECAGRPVDPGRMTVVELVDDPQAAPETVIEQIRPGYVWGDRVIRFAEVRAVRSRAAHQAYDPALPG